MSTPVYGAATGSRISLLFADDEQQQRHHALGSYGDWYFPVCELVRAA
jgi:hypothetical protein